MDEWERDVRLQVLSQFHNFAVSMLTLDGCEPETPLGRAIRKWMQRVKWRLVDNVDPNEYELWLACQRAVDRALHPDRELERAGVVIPKRQIVRASALV